MNIRNTQRDEYIFAERQKGRTYKDIGQEVGISAERVRQVCVQFSRDKRKQTEPRHFTMTCGNECVEKFEDFSEETQKHLVEKIYTTLVNLFADQYHVIIEFEINFRDGTKKRYRTTSGCNCEVINS